MKYFFMADTKGGTHILVAESIENATRIAQKSGSNIESLYELTGERFSVEGFLISSK